MKSVLVKFISNGFVEEVRAIEETDVDVLRPRNDRSVAYGAEQRSVDDDVVQLVSSKEQIDQGQGRFQDRRATMLLHGRAGRTVRTLKTGASVDSRPFLIRRAFRWPNEHLLLRYHGISNARPIRQEGQREYHRGHTDDRQDEEMENRRSSRDFLHHFEGNEVSMIDERLNRKASILSLIIEKFDSFI